MEYFFFSIVQAPAAFLVSLKNPEYFPDTNKFIQSCLSRKNYLNSIILSQSKKQNKTTTNHATNFQSTLNIKIIL